jgi:hypothetical protein
MAQANESLISGLKSSVKKGYSLADFWEGTYNKALYNLLKSWNAIVAESGDAKHPIVAEMAWDTVRHYTHYTAIQSKNIGVYSKIGVMTIPSKTYTTKKGVVKTTPEEQVPAHYTQGGDYINRVSVLGEEPVSYTMELQITPTHFEFVGLGKTLRDCFGLKKDFSDEGEFKVKDISKAGRKAERKALA